MPKLRNIEKQLDITRRAYDKTVDYHKKGINPLAVVPEKFKKSLKFKRFQTTYHSCNSGQPAIKKYLKPKPGMRFLDVGSSANLANYRLDHWSATYYGIDISPELIKAMKNFVLRENIKIGGLYVADIAKLPFKNNFFDIAAAIGVLEYYDIAYIKKALKELNRVLKPEAKMVLDMPSLRHPDIDTMFEFEKYLGRPRLNIPTRQQFENELKKIFSIDKIDDSNLMIKYFARTKKV
ncbi:MAG: class I SAM-dependent methyltransferase [bacterium]